MAAGVDPKFKWVTVQGVKCIVWLYNKNDDELSKAAKRAKRKEKDAVGRENLDIPMLDTKSEGSDRVYCDIIINTSHLDEWEAAIRNQFITQQQTTKKITGGVQLALSNRKDSELFVTVNFYPGTKRLMIQPGHRKEANLLEWLGYFAAMKAIAVGVPISNSSPLHDTHSVPALPSQPAESGLAASSSPLDTGDTTVVHRSPVSSSTKSPVANLAAATGGNSTASSSGSTESELSNTLQFLKPNSSSIHVDELLCFIQNKIDSDNLDNIVKTCVDFYSDVDIEKSKKTLFDLVKPPNRYIKRRAQNKAKDNIVDICTVFYTLDVCDQPTFVAKALNRLPPMSVHEFGVGKILSEIEALKTAVKKLSETGTDRPAQSAGILHMDSSSTAHPLAASSFHGASVHHKTTTSTSTQTSVNNNLCTAEAFTQVILPNSDVFGNIAESTPVTVLPSPIPPARDNSVSVSEEYIVVDYTSCSSPCVVQNDSLYSDISSTSLCFDSEGSDVASETTKSTSSSDLPEPTSKSWAQICREGIRSKTVHKRKSSVTYGTGKSTHVKAATVPSLRRNKPLYLGNKIISGVFLSRLDPGVTARQLQLHIKHETGIECKPEKLKTKFGGYSSFFIRSQGYSRSTIMDPSLWPVGTLVKPFYT